MLARCRGGVQRVGPLSQANPRTELKIGHYKTKDHPEKQIPRCADYVRNDKGDCELRGGVQDAGPLRQALEESFLKRASLAGGLRRPPLQKQTQEHSQE